MCIRNCHYYILSWWNYLDGNGDFFKNPCIYYYYERGIILCHESAYYCRTKPLILLPWITDIIVDMFAPLSWITDIIVDMFVPLSWITDIIVDTFAPLSWITDIIVDMFAPLPWITDIIDVFAPLPWICLSSQNCFVLGSGRNLNVTANTDLIV